MNCNYDRDESPSPSSNDCLMKDVTVLICSGVEGLSIFVSFSTCTCITMYFSVISWRKQVTFHDKDDIRFVLDQHTYIYCASSLKQQSRDRHVAPLWHIILIPSSQVLLSVLSRKVKNTNSMLKQKIPILC